MQWLTYNGGKAKTGDTVRRLSQLGTEGKHPANSERDTHRLMRKTGQYLGAAIDCKQVRLVNPATLEESYQRLPMILPHEFCLALWRCGEDIFNHCLFGKFSEAEVKSFWDHVEEKCDWFDGHPAASWPTRSRLASVGTYGGEVQAYRNSECGSVSVVAWTSELAYLNDSMTRYFPIAIWSEHHESEHTYNDCMKYVVQSFQKLGDPSSRWPWTEKGYFLCYTFAQGDLKWINDRMNLHNFRSIYFCNRCECTKTDPMGNVYNSLTNFMGLRVKPAMVPWLLTYPYILICSLSTLASYQMIYANFEVIIHARMILQPHLGAALIHLCEAGMFGSILGPGQYQDKLQVILRKAHRDFLAFKKFNKLQCSQPRFTPSRLNRRVQTSFLRINMNMIRGFAKFFFRVWWLEVSVFCTYPCSVLSVFFSFGIPQLRLPLLAKQSCCFKNLDAMAS